MCKASRYITYEKYLPILAKAVAAMQQQIIISMTPDHTKADSKWLCCSGEAEKKRYFNEYFETFMLTYQDKDAT